MFKQEYITFGVVVLAFIWGLFELVDYLRGAKK